MSTHKIKGEDYYQCRDVKAERDKLLEEVAELLDRLESAEKEVANIKEVEFPRKMLAVAVGWETKCARLEQERDSLRAALQHEADCVEACKAEVETLLNKIAKMEQQEPVAQVGVHKTGGNAGIAWSARPLNEFDSLPLLRDGDRLYLAPGAQPAQKSVAYLDLGTGGYMDVGTDLNDEQLASLPKGRHMLGIVGTYGVDGYVSAQPVESIKDAIIDDLQSQFDTECITENESGDALIRLSDAIAAVEDNFAQPAPEAKP